MAHGVGGCFLDINSPLWPTVTPLHYIIRALMMHGVCCKLPTNNVVNKHSLAPMPRLFTYVGYYVIKQLEVKKDSSQVALAFNRPILVYG